MTKYGFYILSTSYCTNLRTNFDGVALCLSDVHVCVWCGRCAVLIIMFLTLLMMTCRFMF